MRSGALSHPVLSISPWLRQNENEYKDHLLKVSTTGDWEPWITFFVEALTVESQRAQHRIGELLHLRESLSEEVRQLLPRGRLAVDVVDDLIEFPVISVGAVEHRYDKSNQAARNAVNRLIEVGLLEPFKSSGGQQTVLVVPERAPVCGSGLVADVSVIPRRSPISSAY
jgi:Fic family protein